MRFIALDVHRDFCEVAIAEGGQVRRAGRVETTPATLELFAQSLAADDQVVLVSKTGSPRSTRARVPHRGAHLMGRQAAKQRGRKQPHLLRFSSRSPAPNRTLAKEPPTVQ
jgi:hypothetical protein